MNYQSGKANGRGQETEQTYNYDLAITNYTKAIRLTPDDPLAYYKRANAYYRKGDYEKAITDYNEAIRLKPDYLDAYNNRGTSYDSKGDYDKAITDYNEAIRLKPDYAVAYLNRGDLYSAKGDYNRGIADYSEAIRLKPSFAEAYYNRGLAYKHRGDYDKARIDYGQAIRLKPDFREANGGLAWLLAVCPDPNVRNGEQAVEYAKKACELSEWKDSEVFDILAAAYAEVGDFDNAMKWENKSLASNASYATLERRGQRLSLYEQKKQYHEERP